MPCEQEHGRGSADRGDIVGLDVADHFRQRIEAFLEGVAEPVVHGAEGFGGDLRGFQVG
jgi:hypothetical protein